MADKQFRNGEFCWTELMTTNTTDAKEFYGQLFGWEFEDAPMGDMTYTMFKSNDADNQQGGIIPMQEGVPMPHWMSYIYVTDLDASLEKAQELGATILKPATDAGEMGRLAIIQDPTGAHIALWQSKQ